MVITAWSAWWFLPFVLPVCVWVAWSDMKFMKIPNKAVGALMVVFLVIGLIALPISEYPWRVGQFVIVLAIGFVANMFGLLGAGDAKFAAAAAPFIAPGDLALVMYLLAAVMLAAVATHRVFRMVGPVRALTPDWESWTHRKFPAGLALGAALAFYLIAGAFLGA